MPMFIYEATQIIKDESGNEYEDTESQITYEVEAIDEDDAKKIGNSLLHDNHNSTWSGTYIYRANEKK